MPVRRRKSYATRILGDDRSAIVFFSHTRSLDAPGEICAAGVVTLQGGKIARWVAYWDGRHVGRGFPGGDRQRDGRPRNAVRATAPQQFFAEDAVFEDITANLYVVGPVAIPRFLTSARDRLPYAGPGSAERHTPGRAVGGGYEWTSRGPVPHGVTGLELDARGLTTRATPSGTAHRRRRDARRAGAEDGRALMKAGARIVPLRFAGGKRRVRRSSANPRVIRRERWSRCPRCGSLGCGRSIGSTENVSAEANSFRRGAQRFQNQSLPRACLSACFLRSGVSRSR